MPVQMDNERIALHVIIRANIYSHSIVAGGFGVMS
jgi:hypothetical protein